MESAGAYSIITGRYDDQGAAERQADSTADGGPLHGKRRREQLVEPGWIVAHVALRIVTFDQAMDQHEGKKHRVPVARSQDAKAMAGQQCARLAARKTTDIVHTPVMCRQQPAVGR